MNQQTAVSTSLNETPFDHQESSKQADERNPYFLAQLNFPAKLDRILHSPEFNDIICWLPHGRSWRVMQQKRFEKEVLPVFFRHSNYSSFVRQVNGWGFRRIQSGPDFNSYYHESFLRDDREAHQSMRRPSTQELAERKEKAGDPPPNFYMLPRVDNSSIRGRTASQETLPSKRDSYGESIARKLLSQCSKEGQCLVLRIELVRLDTLRRRVLAALQAVESELIPALATSIEFSTFGGHIAGPGPPPAVANNPLKQRAAREMLRQLHNKQLMLCAPYV